MSTRSFTIHDSVDIDLFELVAEVERLIKAKHTGTDLYKQAVSNLTGVPVDSVPPELRGLAKSASFGVRYGMSSPQIAALVGEAQQLLQKSPPKVE